MTEVCRVLMRKANGRTSSQRVCRNVANQREAQRKVMDDVIIVPADEAKTLTKEGEMDARRACGLEDGPNLRMQGSIQTRIGRTEFRGPFTKPDDHLVLGRVHRR